VKISGMIDESMDKESMKLPPQPWEFRSKPAWQRLIIMIGGVTVNLILGVLIYSMVLFYYGEEYLHVKNMKYGIACDSLALKTGFRNGDKIVSIDGMPADNFAKVIPYIIINQSRHVQVNRNGEEVDVPMSTGIMKALINKESDFILPRVPFVVGEVAKGKPAEKAGLMPGDSLIAVNGNKEVFLFEFQQLAKSSKGKELQLTVFRKGTEVPLTVKVGEDGMIGVRNYSASRFLQSSKKQYGFFAAFPAGMKKGYHTMEDYVKQFKLLFDKDIKGYESLGGFITFGKVFSPEWDWFRFWNLTAFFSIALAFMNLLPIPALDGGHVLFLLYEMIFRRKPSDKFLEYAQTIGMILLLSLLLYANFNDIFKLFK